MQLTTEQKQLLKDLMKKSASKGNLANSGVVLENEETVASAESWVASSYDTTSSRRVPRLPAVGEFGNQIARSA